MKMQTGMVALAAAALSASAGVIHTSEVSLLSEMTGGFSFNDFNSVADGPVGSLSYSIGDFAYEISTGPLFYGGLYNEDGIVSTALSTDSLVIEFTSGNVTAIGANIWATNPGFDPAGALMVVTLSDGTTELFPSGGPNAFYGYTSDLIITSVEIRAVGLFSQRFATMDNFYVGAIVPLPAAGWAGLGMIAAMGGVQSYRRRR